jgi:hypothetical protein
MTSSLDAQKTQITQIEAAVAQFERAATLFMFERDFISAVTLACASENITGQYLNYHAMKSHYEDLKDFSKLELAPNLNDSQINEFHINFARNFLKHRLSEKFFKNNKSDENEKFEFDLENEAIIALCRAGDNIYRLAKLTSKVSEEFSKWLENHRADLIGNAITGRFHKN